MKETREAERIAEQDVGAAMEATAHGVGHMAVEIAAFRVATWLESRAGGIVVSLLVWRILKPPAEKARQARIAQAEHDAEVGRECAAETLASVPTFSDLEGHTGADEEVGGRIA